ncbi:MAG: hypothetical protein RLZZ511_2014 [Cyanobacteriota bacterium]|jgi:hypothetical protein
MIRHEWVGVPFQRARAARIKRDDPNDHPAAQLGLRGWCRRFCLQQVGELHPDRFFPIKH